MTSFAMVALGCGAPPDPTDAVTIDAAHDTRTEDSPPAEAARIDAVDVVDGTAMQLDANRDDGTLRDVSAIDAHPSRDAASDIPAADTATDRPASDSSTSTIATARARVFGYAFGDGNFAAPLLGAAPVDAVLHNGGAEIRADFFAAACAAGYDGAIHSGSSGTAYDCARGGPDHGAPLRVDGFAWPEAGDFARFVAEASAAEQRSFLGAMLTGEGGRCGSIDDQSCGFDGFEQGARINTKMTLLVQMLHGLGFTTARVTRMASGGTSACTGTGRVAIDPSDACHFNAREGFRFATYARVPGSICTSVPMCTNGDATCTEPAPCH